MVDISERNLEQTIEATLLAGGPNAYSGGEDVVVEPLEAHEKPLAGTAKGAVIGARPSFLDYSV
jgi:predicted 2-oxoglutarate/Fe(II)-dependent dioxygenase YbiX